MRPLINYLVGALALMVWDGTFATLILRNQKHLNVFACTLMAYTAGYGVFGLVTLWMIRRSKIGKRQADAHSSFGRNISVPHNQATDDCSHKRREFLISKISKGALIATFVLDVVIILIVNKDAFSPLLTITLVIALSCVTSSIILSLKRYNRGPDK